MGREGLAKEHRADAIFALHVRVEKEAFERIEEGKESRTDSMLSNTNSLRYWHKIFF